MVVSYAADLNTVLVNYQQTATSAFNAIQNDVTATRQAYERAFAELSSELRPTVENLIKLGQEQTAAIWQQQLSESQHQLKQLAVRADAERVQLNSQLEQTTQKMNQRLNDLQIQLGEENKRLRKELTESATNQLVKTQNDLTNQCSNQLNNARSEHQRIQQELGNQLSVARSENERIRQDSNSQLTNQRAATDKRSRDYENRIYALNADFERQRSDLQRYRSEKEAYLKSSYELQLRTCYRTFR